VFLSTDDDDVMRIAAEYPPIQVMERRPPHLATDTARTIDVVLHVLDAMETRGATLPAYIALLQPTAPMRTARHIDEAVELMRSAHGTRDSLASVARLYEPHPHKVKKIEDGLLVSFIEGADSETPRQELPPAYRLNGAIYIAGVEMLRRRRTFFNKTIPYVMDERDSINIDSPEDLELLEIRLQQRAARATSETMPRELKSGV
jgi:CMP-N-acetylneuraminic acid synthetase